MREIWVGVDGGGSKTDVLALDTATRPSALKAVRTGATNPNTVGFEAAAARLREAMAEVVRLLNGGPEDVHGVCVASAGAGHPALASRMQALLSPMFPNANVDVVPDPLAALTANLPTRPGIVLIAGTGSIAMGERADGRVERAGGYGYLVSDEGSGFSIGQACLKAAIASFEGRGPRTSLWPLVQRHFCVSHPRDLVPVIYEDAHPLNRVSEFTAVAMRSEPEDPVVADACQAAVDAHLGLIGSVCRALGYADHEPPPIVVAGGLYAHRGGLWERLTSSAPTIKFVQSERSPVAGALLRAMFRRSMDEHDNKHDSMDAKRRVMERWLEAVDGHAEDKGEGSSDAP